MKSRYDTANKPISGTFTLEDDEDEDSYDDNMDLAGTMKPIHYSKSKKGLNQIMQARR